MLQVRRALGNNFLLNFRRWLGLRRWRLPPMRYIPKLETDVGSSRLKIRTIHQAFILLAVRANRVNDDGVFQVTVTKWLTVKWIDRYLRQKFRYGRRQGIRPGTMGQAKTLHRQSRHGTSQPGLAAVKRSRRSGRRFKP